jgi:hypothetical protein
MRAADADAPGAQPSSVAPPPAALRPPSASAQGMPEQRTMAQRPRTLPPQGRRLVRQKATEDMMINLDVFRAHKHKHSDAEEAKRNSVRRRSKRTWRDVAWLEIDWACGPLGVVDVRGGRFGTFERRAR